MKRRSWLKLLLENLITEYNIRQSISNHIGLELSGRGAPWRNGCIPSLGLSRKQSGLVLQENGCPQCDTNGCQGILINGTKDSSLSDLCLGCADIPCDVVCVYCICLEANFSDHPVQFLMSAEASILSCALLTSPFSLLHTSDISDETEGTPTF